LLGRLHAWAESGWARTASATWGFLQALAVPGPADAVWMPLALSDPPRAFELALMTSLGSILGGATAYAIGVFAFPQIGLPALHLIGVGEARLDWLRDQIARHGWMLVAAGGIPFISPKMVPMAAGAFGMPILPFSLALVGSRVLRGLGGAVLVRFAGTSILRRLGRQAPQSPTGINVERESDSSDASDASDASHNS
jgi:membrane protein YqaA with SNARE-associated domain